MRFSIITATKNNKSGLLRAIECVRNQTYKNVEHIIVDGGSTDGTVDILRSRKKEINSGFVIPANEVRQESTADSGLRRNDINSKKNEPTTTDHQLLYISEPDNGIYDAINKGIKLATGDVIGLLHSDDLYADDKVLEKYAEVFTSDSGQPAYRTGRAGMTRRVEAVYSDLVYVSQKSQPQPNKERSLSQRLISLRLKKSEVQTGIQSNNHSIIRYWKTHKSVISNSSSVNSKNTGHQSLITDDLLRNGWMPPHPTLFIRKEIFEKYGYYKTDMKIAADYEMILRLLYKHKITAHYLPVTTYLMTIGGASNKSLKNIVQKSKEDYQAMKMNGIDSPLLTLISKNLRKLPQFLARDL